MRALILGATGGIGRCLVEILSPHHQLFLVASTAMHPLVRIATPQEVAAAAAWFMEPEQAFITGQVLSIGGRLSKVKTRG